MGKKYKTKLDPETGLLRIIALKDFSNVKKGDKGGLIEKKENLSQEGNCWIYDDNARVFGDAMVFGDAEVYGEASVCGNAKISGNVKLYSTKVSWITTSIKDSKDYVILGTKAGFHIFSLSNNTEEDTSIVEEDYLKNIKTIRQLYGKEV